MLTGAAIAERSADYQSERELVDALVSILASASPWGAVVSGCEFNYQRGRTDVVGVDELGQVIAFEAKLSRWRIALHQAYRNTCFAHRSYVVLPKCVAIRASQCSAEFYRLGVGLCYIEDGIHILYESGRGAPLQPWLSDKAAKHVMDKHA